MPHFWGVANYKDPRVRVLQVDFHLRQRPSHTPQRRTRIGRCSGLVRGPATARMLGLVLGASASESQLWWDHNLHMGSKLSDLLTVNVTKQLPTGMILQAEANKIPLGATLWFRWDNMARRPKKLVKIAVRV